LRAALENVEATDIECVTAIQKRGLIEKCVVTYDAELSKKPNPARKAQILTALGHIYGAQGDHATAYGIRLDVAKSRGRGIDWYRAGLSALASQKLVESKDAFRRALASSNLPSDIRKSLASEFVVPK
jgi:hypothetical protein